jgi:UDP-glucuronate decarboxylase
VDDLIDGLIRLMASERGFTGPVNLGNPVEFSMLELAQQVIRLTKSRSRIQYKPLPQDDPKQRQPDIALAKKRLKWKPTVALEDGLKETIRYFRGVLKK